MCGIVGIIARSEDVAREALPRMNDAQAHRGPDDFGTHYLTFGDRTLGLGHRRLSIIDLSAYGHQPMVHPTTGDQIIFNGEIYNFRDLRRELEKLGARFLGHSDTEVLLHALSEWGVDVLPRLQGMFAFAFYNSRSHELLLARDPIGIKPLYFARAPGVFCFSSEVCAILSAGLVDTSLDQAGVAGLLAYGSVQHPRTIFHAIHSFSPGAYRIITPGSIESSPARTHYWSFPEPRLAPVEGELLSMIRNSVESSVRDHLVADVPVGVFLSSGLDSTIVAGTGRKMTSHLRSFTVGFEDNPDMSEMELASETAKHFGLDHTEIQVTAKDAETSTVEWLQSMDTPSMDGLNVYIISKAVVARGITVALSGQGGDELFGGYPSFQDVPTLFKIARKTGWIPAKLRRLITRAAVIGKSEAVIQKALEIAGGNGSLISLYAQRRRVMSNAQLADIGFEWRALGLTDDFLDPEIVANLRVIDKDPIWSISQLESRLYMGNMLLPDGDVNSMAHSLEIRVPLLSHRLLDLAYALPGQVRLPHGRADKHLLRCAFSELLRPALLQQDKKGFTLPVRRWMLGPLRDLCEGGLEHLSDNPFFRREGIDTVWNAFVREPESPMWSRAFTLCVLGLYLRDNHIT